MVHITGTSVLNSGFPHLTNFWRATTTSTYKSEMVQLRSNNPVKECSYLLAEPAKYSFFLLTLHWLNLFLLLFALRSLCVVSLCLAELLGRDDSLERDFAVADMLLFSDPTLGFRTTWMFSSWKWCNEIRVIKSHAVWCVMLIKRRSEEDILQIYQLVYKGNRYIISALLPELERRNIKSNGFSVRCCVVPATWA